MPLQRGLSGPWAGRASSHSLTLLNITGAGLVLLEVVWPLYVQESLGSVPSGGLLISNEFFQAVVPVATDVAFLVGKHLEAICLQVVVSSVLWMLVYSLAAHVCVFLRKLIAFFCRVDVDVEASFLFYFTLSCVVVVWSSNQI